MNIQRERNCVGDPGWIRTSDLQLRRLLLYPLSYGAATGKLVAQEAVRPPAERAGAQPFSVVTRVGTRAYVTFLPPTFNPASSPGGCSRAVDAGRRLPPG